MSSSLEFLFDEKEGGYVVVKCEQDTEGEVVIPDTYEGKPVVGIGEAAFCSCQKMTSVIVPNSVKQMGFHAFRECSALTSFVVPDGVSVIPVSGFFRCSSLTEITIPATVKEIAVKAFKWDYKLDTIHFGGTVEEWNAVEKSITDWDEWDEIYGRYTVYCTDGVVDDCF